MNRGDRLPSLTLADARDGRPVRLRAPELGSVLLFLLHGADCEPCRAYLRGLADADDVFRIWGARRIAVVPGEAAEEEPGVGAGASFPVAADPDAALRAVLGSEPGGAALVIADRFGECYHVTLLPGSDHGAGADHGAGPDHGVLPGPEEIEAWLSFLGTQCPECGVPDSAGLGEWDLAASREALHRPDGGETRLRLPTRGRGRS
jgi:hypothetical protein